MLFRSEYLRKPTGLELTSSAWNVSLLTYKWPHRQTRARARAHTHTHTHTHSAGIFFWFSLSWLFCMTVIVRIFWPCGLMEFRTHHLKIWQPGVLNIWGWGNLKEQQKQEGYSDPSHHPSSLKTGHKTFKWGTPSLYPEEKSILVSEDQGTPSRIRTGLARFSPVYFTHLIFLKLSYFYLTAHSSSSLA